VIAASLVLALALQAQAPAVLQRTPSDLPAAEPGAWADWSATEAPTGRLLELFELSVRAYQRADYGAALHASFALLDEFPGYPPSLHQLGVVYFRLRRYGDAIAAFELLLDVAPDQVAQTRALAHSYYSLGRYDQALVHYGAVLATDPENESTRKGIALTQMRLGKLELALETLLELSAEDDPDPDTLTWTAQVLFDLERSDEARTFAERAQERAPFEPKAWFLLARIHFDAGRDEEAQKHQDRFKELDRSAQVVRRLKADLLLRPHDLELTRALVAAHAEVGNLAAAKKTLVRLAGARARELEVWIYALDAFEELGDGALAAQAAQQIEQRFPDSVDAWRRLERYFARIKDRMRQIQAGERALRLSE